MLEPASSLIAFIQRWQESSGNERGNYQLFLSEWCDLLGVARPNPKGAIAGDPYCFDRDVTIYHPSGKKSAGFIDLYKEHCFILEAKQGGVSGGKVGTAKRGTETYRKAMRGAFNQAVSYARTFKNRPPFLITCDIGESFQIWSDFGAASELDYGSYDARQEIPFADLAKPEIFELFVDIFTDPQKRNPEKIAAQVTREVAADLAELAKSLEAEGRNPKLVADFLMRCIFTMFAEDVGLLQKEPILTENLEERWQPNPHKFQAGIEALWAAMNEGKPFWDYGKLLQFNGGLFEDASAIALNGEQLATLLQAAKRDWRKVEPAIFGTLLERALDTKERSKLGAHYTPRAYVERLVRPVVLEPLRERWRLVQIAVDGALGMGEEPQTSKGENSRLDKGLKPLAPEEIEAIEPTKIQRDRAVLELENFLKELREIKILDPACGTGNFLYVTMDLMKELESEVLARLAEVSGRDQLRLDFEQINPSQFLGIEINPRAAAIADLVVWIGYLQWHFRRFGDVPPIEPVLRAYHNIENRDAVLAYDGVEPDIDPKTGQVRTRWGGRTMVHPVTGKAVPDPSDQKVIYRYLNPRPAEWPAADYIVSNPPFLGKLGMLEKLTESYINALRFAYRGTQIDGADFVMYWWYKAFSLLKSQQSKRFGLITTKSINQTFNRKVIDSEFFANPEYAFAFAIPNHPWISSEDAAQVRVAMTVVDISKKSGILRLITKEEEQNGEFHLEFSQATGLIHSNLKIGVNINDSQSLNANSLICGTGLIIGNRGFIISTQELLDMVKLYPESKNIIFPIKNGRDIGGIDRNFFVIDTNELNEKDLFEKYPIIYQRLRELVYPERQVNRDQRLRTFWWQFRRSNQYIRSAIKDLDRYIVTSETSKYRFFKFLNKPTYPEHKLVVIATQDAFLLGCLSSLIHVVWSVYSGGRLGAGNDLVYVKTKCFEQFPFPDPDDRLKQEIRELGDRLDAHRKTVQANHPDITITGMYNLLEKIRAGQPLTDKDREFNQRALVSTLKQIHDDLDRAVFRAYGWDDLIPLLTQTRGLSPLPPNDDRPLPPNAEPANGLDEAILERLVKLNAERAEEERNGHIRWLRPNYQAPSQTAPTGQQTDLPIALPSPDQTRGLSPLPPTDRPLPKGFKERVAAVRDLFRTEGGEWTIDRAASRFSGKNTKTKKQQIAQAIEALEGAGLLLSYTDNGEQHWYDASLQAIA